MRRKILNILAVLAILATLLASLIVAGVNATGALSGYLTIGGASNGYLTIGGTGTGRVTIGSGTGTSFTPTITISAPSGITYTSATLNGNITAIGADNPTVTLYWGTTDGGNTAADWVNSAPPTVPAQPQGVAAFHLSLTGLTPNTTYYYNAYAFNTAGGAWAGSSSFQTLPGGATTTATGLTTTGGSTLSATSIARTLLPIAIIIIGIVIVVLFISKGNIKAALVAGLIMVVAVILTFVLVRALL